MSRLNYVFTTPGCFFSDIGSSLRSVEIVQFLNELITLNINGKTLFSLQFKDGRFSPLAAIEMTGHLHGKKDFQVIGDVAAVFQVEAEKICILHLGGLCSKYRPLV